MKKEMLIKFDLYNLMAIVGLGFLGFAFWSVRGFLLMLVVALVLSTFIEDFVIRGERYKIPRFVSVLLFYLAIFILFSGIIIFIIPVLVNEVGTLAHYYPSITEFIHVKEVTSSLGEVSSLSEALDRLKDVSFQTIFLNIGSFFGGVFNVILVFIVSFYLSMQGNSIDRLLKIFAPKRYESSISRVWHTTQKKIGGWFRGQLVIALLLTVITYIGLSLMGIPYAFLLSMLAGLFGLVPYGIFIALIPAAMLAGFKIGWQMGIGVVFFYWIVQQVLDYGIQPLLFKKMIGIPPLIVILSVIAGAQLFGMAGLIIAVPVSIFGLEIIAEIEHHKNINHHE